MPRSSPKFTLVLNSGSSSLKSALFQGERLMVRASQDRLHRRPAWRQAFQRMAKAINRVHPPDMVAHRIVHGGGLFHQPTKLTPKVLRKLQSIVELAPNHMPANLAGVQLSVRTWPVARQWGVFDTSLYDHLPRRARLYSIPLGLAKKLHIRKYGFHGISHAWAFQHAGRDLGRQLRRTNAVTIHLGAGDSVTRWRSGRVEDTSMGFTPLEGLTMATRSGDIDPMIPLYLQEHGGFLAQEVRSILQDRSGLVGLTGLRDVRDVLAAAGHLVPGQPRRGWSSEQRHHARLALEMFCYDVQRYLASYLGLLPRCDLIVFTGAVGQNAYLRQQILRGVPAAKNIRVRYVPADEESAIAEAVWKMLK